MEQNKSFYGNGLAELAASFVRPLEDRSCGVKETVVFECEISKPNLKAKWYQGGTEITKKMKRFTPEQDGAVHRLKIVEAELDDEKKYSCYIEDVKTAAKLTVKGEIQNLRHGYF